MGSQMAPTSPALTTSSYGILSPRSETSHPTRARSSTVGSADSSSSFEFANAETASEGYSEESGDEIVWNLPRCHQNEDDDFVVLSRRPEVENVCTPVRKTDKETVAVTPRDSNAQEAPLDDTLASNHGARCSTLPTSSAKPQLRWADEGFDNEDQKSSDGHQGASASNIQSLPTPNVTPKRDVGLGKRYPSFGNSSPAQFHGSPFPNRHRPSAAKDKGEEEEVQVQTEDTGKKQFECLRRRREGRGKRSLAESQPRHPRESTRPTRRQSTLLLFRRRKITYLPAQFVFQFPIQPRSAKATQHAASRSSSLLSLSSASFHPYLTFPSSLKAAKNFLKAKAFLNIREYISVRDQGRDAVQKVMYPSRNALVKALRGGKNQRVNLRSFLWAVVSIAIISPLLPPYSP
ncbi:hypothetical protein FA13DRAFT_1706532 [Coprinellus micaceus]|uniref:Uncharacterized protein n=1 Tax=Coprinellus micaceus TaxID=71717 RepID=A0A4Y7TQT7_COPMI|nr:hypothetical protein FA13DRAFT_1706532 [Coprinellus micaceus]